MNTFTHITSPMSDLLVSLHDHAVNRPEHVAVIMLADGEHESERLTYAGLDEKVRRKAAVLLSRDLQGQRVLVAEPPGVDFLVAFLACLRAGVVAVPVPDRPQGRWASQVLAIAADCEATAVMAPMAWPALDLPLISGEVEGLSLPASVRPVARGDEALAYLQYTSGSTAAPKGVMVTFGNLAANQAMIMEAQSLVNHRNDVFLSWLPPYHDMGLVGGMLQPLLLGATSVLMHPLYMLARPLRWLKAIARYRVAVTGGPNFAFQTCVERVRPEDVRGLDLSCWRLAYVGAEPVRLSTMDAFAALLHATGFERQAFYPCYGMAETVLFATGGEAGAGLLAADLGANGGREVTACGHAWAGAQVCVVDPLTHEACAEGVPGEIWLAGPHVAAGYWQRQEDTQRRFKGRLVGCSTLDFLRSGDRGVMQGGQLYVLGRLDDLIIVRGANHHPEDLEAQLCTAHPDLAAALVFQTQGAGMQQLVVAVELKRQAIGKTLQQQLKSELAASLTKVAGLRADAVLLLRPGSFYRTSSGKPRRRACAEAYSLGTWPALKAIEHGT
jgi:acyl-CoA synthetase (AMP-forming)/AMP-acid ligase II